MKNNGSSAGPAPAPAPARGLATAGLQRQCGLRAPWPGSWAGLRARSMAQAPGPGSDKVHGQG